MLAYLTTLRDRRIELQGLKRDGDDEIIRLQEIKNITEILRNYEAMLNMAG